MGVEERRLDHTCRLVTFDCGSRIPGTIRLRISITIDQLTIEAALDRQRNGAKNSHGNVGHRTVHRPKHKRGLAREGVIEQRYLEEIIAGFF